jgi:hypothetical protein
MRCNASPTTCTAVEPPAARDLAARTVAAILFREVLRPLAAGLGPLGEIAVGPVAERLAGILKR